MKRIAMLATLLAFVLGMAATASAADLVTSGSFKIAATWQDNYDFVDADDNAATANSSEDDFDVTQRVRTSFQWVANENLQGVLQIEIGTSAWGTPGGGMDISADAQVIEVKHAYVSFVWPNTSVSLTAGVMPVALPGGPGGSPILDDDVAGLVASAPLLDNLSFLAGWIRPYDNIADSRGNDDGATTDNNLDAIFLALPMSFMDDGIALTPYAAYVYAGDDTLADYIGTGNTDLLGLLSQNRTLTDDDQDADILYLGLTFDVSLLDPFNLSGAVHWGSMEGPDNFDRAGWMGELQLTYTGWDFVTPALYFGYSSGEDGNATGGDDTYSSGDGESERLPQISEGYGIGTFWSGNDWLDSDITGGGEMGFWNVGLILSDISFVDGLTHEIFIIYTEGTNDKTTGSRYGNGGNGGYGSYLTEKDSLWEFDLNTKYQIYDELSAVVRLGYIAMDYDEEYWTEIRGVNDGAEEDAAKLLIGLEYAF